MSLLLETSVVPVLGNTYKVNILLTVIVLCLSDQVICHTNKSWEFFHYIHCFCSDLWCLIKLHGTKPVCTSWVSDPLAFCLGKYRLMNFCYAEEMLGGCATAKNKIIAIEYTLLWNKMKVVICYWWFSAESVFCKKPFLIKYIISSFLVPTWDQPTARLASSSWLLAQPLWAWLWGGLGQVSW